MRSTWTWGVIATAVFALLTLWYWVNRPTQTIGAAELVPAEGVPGTKVDICITDLVWYRICPSATYATIVASDGSRYDLPVHPVNHPQQSTPVHIKRKCREWGPIPNIIPGLAKVVTRVESYCPMNPFTITTRVPDMPLMVKR